MYSLRHHTYDVNACSETASLFRTAEPPRIPENLEDNTPEGLDLLLRANRIYRELPWPAPFDHSTHQVHLADSRNLQFLKIDSVDLVVTSPPYWTLKEYERGCESQLGDIEQYELFLKELDKVWKECV